MKVRLSVMYLIIAHLHETVYYAEYNGHGDGYKPEKRAAYVHQLDEAQAAFYNIENVMHS